MLRDGNRSTLISVSMCSTSSIGNDLLGSTIPEVAQHSQHQGIGVVLGHQADTVDLMHVHQAIVVAAEQPRIFESPLA